MRPSPLALLATAAVDAAGASSPSGSPWLPMALDGLTVGQNPHGGDPPPPDPLLGARTADSLALHDPTPTATNDTSLSNYASLYDPTFSIPAGASGVLEFRLRTNGIPEGAAVCLGYSDALADLNASADLQAFVGLRRLALGLRAGGGGWVLRMVDDCAGAPAPRAVGFLEGLPAALMERRRVAPVSALRGGSSFS